jgi:hypothetical protein
MKYKISSFNIPPVDAVFETDSLDDALRILLTLLEAAVV